MADWHRRRNYGKKHIMNNHDLSIIAYTAPASSKALTMTKKYLIEDVRNLLDKVS